jgi:hypothetical protein
MTDLIVLAVMLLAAGTLSGLLAGVFGVGGGTVVVPVLYEVFVALGVPDELRMPLCAGTSLALIIPTSIVHEPPQNECSEFQLAEAVERSDHRGRDRRDRAGALRARSIHRPYRTRQCFFEAVTSGSPVERSGIAPACASLGVGPRRYSTSSSTGRSIASSPSRACCSIHGSSVALKALL